MHFSAVLIAAIACATGIVADTHVYAWCADRKFKGLTESNPPNSDATRKACNKYKTSNMGNEWWDKCPDCSTSLRGDVLVCNSPAEHIGGDEWESFCQQSGANMGKAS